MHHSPESTPSRLLIDNHIAIGAFDFDGNILATDTITYVIDRETGEEVGIPAHALDQHPEWLIGDQARYRWHEYFPDSVRFFRDFYTDPEHRWPDEFKNDVEQALREGKFSPSIPDLIETFFVPARLCAIITARGHSPDNITRILWIISEALLTEEQKAEQYQNIWTLYTALFPGKKLKNRDEALRFYFQSLVWVYPVSNEHDARHLGIAHESSMSKRKVQALKHYIQEVTEHILIPLRLTDTPLAIGFSDDSLGNMQTMLWYFQSEKAQGNYKRDKIRLYFSGKKEDYAALDLPWVDAQQEKNMLVIRL